MSPTVDIRPITLPEIHTVHHFLSQQLKQQFPDWPPQAICQYSEFWNPVALTQRIERHDSALFAAWNADKHPIGLLLGTAQEGGVATIAWLIVAAEHQKAGIGRALFAAACERYVALGLHKVILTAPNETACAFYRHLGMQEEGHHPDHWWHIDFWSFGYPLDNA